MSQTIMNLRLLAAIAITSTFAAVAPLTTHAQPAAGYPAKPIRFVIPFPPGGSNDIVGRLLATSLSERLGRQVIADNRAGGNSIIGTELVANSPPDGYTMLIISTSFTTNPVIHKLPFDPLKSFDWVAMLGVGPNVLAVTQSLPAKNIKELIALAKAKPGQIIYASTGVGSNAHFGTELFKHMTGTNMLHVPYKGGGPALIDTVSGEAQICLSSLIQALVHIRANKLRAIGTSGATRTPILPDVPTIMEAGVPGYETYNTAGDHPAPERRDRRGAEIARDGKTAARRSRRTGNQITRRTGQTRRGGNGQMAKTRQACRHQGRVIYSPRT
jgi:tripartite-type tricarboxylate transporter receptor subunit TctC